MSESASESCCLEIPCGCTSWLTAFCDYVAITFEYCGETTEFLSARSKGVKFESQNNLTNVHMSDRIFRISTQENAVEVGAGAVITDADGAEWVVYATEYLTSFCVWKLWARSVAACFLLTETIDVLEEDCEDCDCSQETVYRRVARVKGSVYAETGQIQSRNDGRDLVYQYSGDLVKWPLSDKPSARHRLKTKTGSYKITRVSDQGKFVPFKVGLEKESADCSVRGS